METRDIEEHMYEIEEDGGKGDADKGEWGDGI